MHKAQRKPKLKIDGLGTPTQEFFQHLNQLFFSKIDCPCHIDNIFRLCLLSIFIQEKNSLNIRLSICKKN